MVCVRQHAGRDVPVGREPLYHLVVVEEFQFAAAGHLQIVDSDLAAFSFDENGLAGAAGIDTDPSQPK